MYEGRPHPLLGCSFLDALRARGVEITQFSHIFLSFSLIDNAAKESPFGHRCAKDAMERHNEVLIHACSKVSPHNSPRVINEHWLTP